VPWDINAVPSPSHHDTTQHQYLRPPTQETECRHAAQITKPRALQSLEAKARRKKISDLKLAETAGMGCLAALQDRC